MKTFSRSMSLPYWPKSKFHGAGPRMRSCEDGAYLLEAAEEREQETLREYSDEVSLRVEDYARKTKVLEAYCESLESRISEMQQDYHEEQKRYECEDKEIVSAMKLMRAYIERLEDDNKVLTETLGKQELQMEVQSTASGGNLESTPADSRTVKQANTRSGKGGADWNIVSSLARKLSQVQQENTSLKNAMLEKREATEELIRSTTALRDQLDEIRYEKERLTTKCESLEEASHALAEEIDENGRGTTKGDHMEFLYTRVEELEEMNDLLQKEVHELKKILDKTEPSMLLRTSDGDKADFMQRKVTVPSRKKLPVIVETVEGDSDIESDNEEEASQNSRNRDAEHSENNTDEHTPGTSKTDTSSFHPAHLKNTLDTSIKEKDELEPQLPHGNLGSISRRGSEGSNRSRSASLEEMQNYLQEMVALQKASGYGDRESTRDQSEVSREKDCCPSAQGISDARVEILKTLDKQNIWRKMLLRRSKHEETTTKQILEATMETKPREAAPDKEGVWC